MLKSRYSNYNLECGIDEAGRGCLAGPVTAAAVILKANFKHDLIDDSKKLSKIKREELSKIIKENSIAYSIQFIDSRKIDEVNILNASILAMHKCIKNLSVKPEFLIIDGNRFKKYKDIPHETVIKGDGKYLNIASASILAKHARDNYMQNISRYCIAKNACIRCFS